MSVKCWASVAGAGQYPSSPSQYFMLKYLHDFFNLFFFQISYNYIYIHSTHNIQYRTKENKTIRKGPCKVITIADIKKKFG